METILLSDLWSTATVLLGFQVAAFAWRINREITMEAKEERTWLTCADGFVALSFIALVVGVFVGPVAGWVSTDMAARLLGVALLSMLAAPFILAAHYNLYCSWGKYVCGRPRITRQEQVAVVTAPFVNVAGWFILFYG